MSRFCYLAPILIAPLALLAPLGCHGQDGSPGEQNDALKAEQQFIQGQTESLERAEMLAYRHLEERHEQLLAGVEAVWTEAVRIDRLGMAHTKVVQTVDNIPVFGAVAIVHTGADGEFAGVTDGLLRDIDVDTDPRLTDLQAIDLAVDSTGGWQRVSEAPRAELYILRRDRRDHLVYRVTLRHLQPGQHPSLPVVFVDAHDGTEIWQYDDMRHWALSNGDQVTYDMHEKTKFEAATVGDSSDSTLLENYDSVRATIKFLSIRVGRDSYDGNGAVIKSYGHYGSNYNNAFWDASAQRLVLGDGDGVNFGHFGVQDIVAHELGHAVADNEANFTYYGESGAIDESNADITAAAVADYTNSDWVFDIGEDCWLPLDPSVALRYMGHPSDDGSSKDHYSERYTGSADNGGVHFNSGIANHFFYLLVEGGQHHDPKLRSGNVINGVGMDTAYQIWYRALSVYMLPSSNFTVAREATAKACGDLYGAGTCDQVAKAWHEVGVGSAP